MGAKLKSETHLQNTFLGFVSQFLRFWLQSYKKVFIWPKTIFFDKIILDIKNSEFDADFESINKVVTKCTKKKLEPKKVWRTWVKVKKVHISVRFLLITFFWCIYSKLFQWIQNQHEILRFLIPLLKFWITNFLLLLLALFVNFDCKCTGNGSKKRKIFFYECVLEFN